MQLWNCLPFDTNSRRLISKRQRKEEVRDKWKARICIVRHDLHRRTIKMIRIDSVSQQWFECSSTKGGSASRWFQWKGKLKGSEKESSWSRLRWVSRGPRDKPSVWTTMMRRNERWRSKEKRRKYRDGWKAWLVKLFNKMKIAVSFFISWTFIIHVPLHLIYTDLKNFSFRYNFY